MTSPATGKSVVLLGATGTIGRATADALVAAGHRVTAPVRGEATLPAQIQTVRADVTDTRQISAILRDARAETIVSCMASRTGAPKDAWAVDHQAHMSVLAAAKATQVPQFVLLSAICVQKPELAFQQAKLAFEAALTESGLTYAIVRPTAFFKSLSGQVARVQAGKPFLLFGDGQVTACKPISDRDMGQFLARCVSDPDATNRILPIGGPGPAISPHDQAEYLFAALGQTPKVKHVPLRMMDAIIGVLATAGLVFPAARAKADLARIGRYYARESMLVWDPVAQRYDADATPEFGQDTLFDHYDRLLAGEVQTDLGAHAVF